MAWTMPLRIADHWWSLQNRAVIFYPSLIGENAVFGALTNQNECLSDEMLLNILVFFFFSLSIRAHLSDTYMVQTSASGRQNNH